MIIELKFTIKEAIAFQTEDLARWEKILKPEIFAKLKQWAIEKNSIETNPYNIRRGMDLQQRITENLLYC